MDSSDDEDVSASAAEVGDKYMQETTLHGLVVAAVHVATLGRPPAKVG